MKAIIISSLLFFSLKAMSAEVGENKGPVCSASTQTSERAAKEKIQQAEAPKEDIKPVKGIISV